MSGKNTVSSDGTAKPKFDFKAWWGKLDPKKRQMYSMVGAGAGVLLLAIGVVSSGGGGSNQRDVRQARLENALMPEDGGRELGLAGVSRDQQELRQENRELENKVERLTQQLDRLQSSNGAQTQAERMDAELESLRRELAELKTEQQRDGARSGAQAPQVPGIGQPPVAPAVSTVATSAQIRTVGGSGSSSTGQNVASGGAPAVRTNAEALQQRQAEEATRETENYLPSGTMLTGVLLTGIDAPTGRAALRDPLPVLMRLKRSAVLPNRFRADYRECFGLLEAVGDLPSERAMMRLINISCVRPDRSVIDVPVQGFAIGEDGRAGLRGTVVSKQGQAISKAMLAGFADGVSRAFGGNNNTMGNLGAGELPSGGDIGASGVMGGASSALDRVAQYFLDLASQLHPVIEIDSGRQVTVVMQRGRVMAGRQGSEGSRGSND